MSEVLSRKVEAERQGHSIVKEAGPCHGSGTTVHDDWLWYAPTCIFPQLLLRKVLALKVLKLTSDPCHHMTSHYIMPDNESQPRQPRWVLGRPSTTCRKTAASEKAWASRGIGRRTCAVTETLCFGPENRLFRK